MTIEFSLGDQESLRQGIKSLIRDIDVVNVNRECDITFRDYRFVGVDEDGQSLGKPKVCKASFYSALANNDELRELLVAYVQQLIAYNLFVYKLTGPGESILIKDPVNALVLAGPQYIDLYCNAFACSDRGYGLKFDKPKRQIVNLYADSEQMALFYAALTIGRLRLYVVDDSEKLVLPKPPKSLIDHLSNRDNCDHFIKLCAAEYISDELFREPDEYHLGLSALNIEYLIDDIDSHEKQFGDAETLMLLSKLTGRTGTDIAQGLRTEITGILDGSKQPVKPVSFDFPTPEWVIKKHNEYEESKRNSQSFANH